MLVVARRPDEALVLTVDPDKSPGDEVLCITIKVLESSPTRVKLGIEAPDNIRIWRDP